MSKQDWNQSQYYQEDFLANHSVQPGSEEARKMTVTSGLRCLELYRRSDPVGLLVRMLLGSSRWRSTQCYLTWKASATPAKRSLFRLVPSMPRIEETAVPFWPTPTARDCKGANSMEHLAREGSRNHTDQLANAVRLWPTPRANDGEKRGNVSADPRNGLPGAVCLWPTPPCGGEQRPFSSGSKTWGSCSSGCNVPNTDNQRLQIPGYEPGFQTVQPKDRIELGYRWPAEPDVGRVAHGVSHRVDRLKCLGNAVVPQQFYLIFAAIAEIERRSYVK